jgi:hypothetical protein
MGRVVGSLCVVAARDGDAESGMLASWVSQVPLSPTCRASVRPSVCLSVCLSAGVLGVCPLIIPPSRALRMPVGMALELAAGPPFHTRAQGVLAQAYVLPMRLRSVLDLSVWQPSDLSCLVDVRPAIGGLMVALWFVCLSGSPLICLSHRRPLTHRA